MATIGYLLWWATTPTNATVSAAGPITVTDQFGRESTFTPQAGVVRLTLDASPVFLSGPVTKVTAGSSPLSVSVPDTAVTGATVPVTVTADLTSGDRLPGLVMVNVDGTYAALAPRKGESRSVTVDVPATEVRGERDLNVTVSTWTGAFARLAARTDVIAPLVAEGRPRITAGTNGYEYGLDLSVTNNSLVVEATASRLSWRLGSLNGVVTDPVTVGPGETVRVTVPLTGVAPYTGYSYTVNAFAADTTASSTFSMTFSPIEKQGESAFAPLDLNSLARWRAINGGTRADAADLGGNLKFNYTDDALIVTAVITDDTHNANRTDPALGWQVDSIQYDIYTGFPGTAGGSRVEITSALLPSGPVAYSHAAPPGQSTGPTPGANVSITRDEVAKTTTYNLAVPWTSLGVEGPPSSVFGISFLVNDADARTGGDARDGNLEWGSGVGGAPKNPAKFRSAQLVGPLGG